MTKFYEPISEESIFDEINRICGTTNESYSNKKKVAYLNEALDKYWILAAESAPQGTLDDTSRTSPPIETQSLVSGTNAYKMTAFTNEVLHILRFSVLDSNSIEHDLVYVPFESVQDFLQEYSTSTTGIPMYWTKVGDYVYIGPTPNYSISSGLRCYANRELAKLAWTTFTITIAAPGVVTATSHGLSDGDVVILVTDGALPTGLTADTTIYYVDQQTSDTFKLCTTPSNVGSTYITTTGSQSGTHKYVKVSGEPGIPVVHHDFLSRYAAMKFMKADHPNFAKTIQEIALDRRDIQDYWERTVRDGRTVINTSKRAYK